MSLAQLSIKRPIFITCIVLAMLVMGFLGLKRMPVDLFPDVTFPVVSIQTVYPGAPPEDVEELVSKPIEEELGGLAGLKTISSQNLESVSVVIAEFELGTDIKESEQQIRDRLGNVRRNLPGEIKDPVIRRLDPSSQPILKIAVKTSLTVADAFDLVDKTVKPQIERLGGVGQVDILGGRKREVQVLVNKAQLQKRELSVMQIARQIEATSKDVPIGKVTGGKSELSFRSTGEFENIKALEKVTVNFLGSDRAVRLGELAHVEEGLEREKTRSYLNGEPALFLDVYKQSGGNTMAVASAVKNSLQSINQILKAQGVAAEVSLVRDGSRAIALNVADVKESIFIGIALCVVVVFFFLGSARSTLITGMALPNSLLGAFLLMSIAGFSVNIMTLLALSLAVGLLIDDAIVVRENIFRHMELGESPEVAAVKGTQEVAVAVIATTLVVFAVFGPIAFLQGIVGQFFKQFGLTMVFAVGISLFDALTIAPMLSAYLASPAEHGKGTGPVARVLKAFDNFQTKLENIYERMLRFTIRRPLVILTGAFVLFVASLGLLKFIPATFLPPADNGEFEVRVELAPGSSIDATASLIKDIDQVVRKHPEVTVVASTVGNINEEVQKGNLYILLKPSKERGKKTSQLKAEVRKDLESLTSRGRILVTDFDAVGGGQRPFILNVSGNDLTVLSKYVEEIKAEIAKIPGLVEVDTNYRVGKPEFQVRFDRSRSEDLGVSTASAGAELRARVEGVVAATYRNKGNDYDIRVLLEAQDRDLRKEFVTTVIPNVNFNMIPLSRVASPFETTGFSQVNRQDRARYIEISGDVGPGGALNSIMQATNGILTSHKAPPGVNARFKGQAKDFQELIANIILAIGMGILFIYLVLASLYESFITPFTILLALPLAVCGALAALWVCNSRLDIFSMIGVVMLMGVVAKNSILLVDYTNQLLAEGKSRSEALVEACRTRLRPILMTSFALIAGMVPIAIGLNEASAQRTSMGIALIGGLISSTLLTLLVVPAAFGYIDRFRVWLLKMLKKMRKQ